MVYIGILHSFHILVWYKREFTLIMQERRILSEIFVVLFLQNQILWVSQSNSHSQGLTNEQIFWIIARHVKESVVFFEEHHARVRHRRVLGTRVGEHAQIARAFFPKYFAIN